MQVASIKTKALTGRHGSNIKACCVTSVQGFWTVYGHVNCVSSGECDQIEAIGPTVAVKLMWILLLPFSSAGSFLASWWSDCNSVWHSHFCIATPPRTHTSCAPHTQILFTHWCSRSLFYSCFYFYLFLMLTCTKVTHTLSPSHTNSLKCSLLHTHNTSNPPPTTHPLSLLLLLVLSLLATLPLGSVSRSGLKELAPCTQSALFSRTSMWAGEIVESWVPQSSESPAREQTGEFLSTRPHHIWANLVQTLLFFLWQVT